MNENTKKAIKEFDTAQSYIEKLGFSILGCSLNDLHKCYFGFCAYDKKSADYPFGEEKGYIEQGIKGQPTKVIFF